MTGFVVQGHIFVQDTGGNVSRRDIFDSVTATRERLKFGARACFSHSVHYNHPVTLKTEWQRQHLTKNVYVI